MKTRSLFLDCALLHISQHASFLTVAFSAGVCYVLRKLRQELNKNNHDPKSNISEPKRWHPGFTDCP